MHRRSASRPREAYRAHRPLPPTRPAKQVPGESPPRWVESSRQGVLPGGNRFRRLDGLQGRRGNQEVRRSEHALRKNRLRRSGGEQQKGSQSEPVVRTKKGATVTRPILALWNDYSKAKGGWEDVDGGGLRGDSEEVLRRWADGPGNRQGIGAFPKDGGQGDRQPGSPGPSAEPAARAADDRAVPDDHRRLAGGGPIAAPQAAAYSPAE